MKGINPQRLLTGGKIDRNRPLTFRFEGRTYRGFQGDTLASALLANGVSVVGRSFKYHRPRGVMAAGVEEPNAIVQLDCSVGSIPNVQATEILLYDGLSARAVNCWPNARFDLGAINNLAYRFLPTGFYYKTFIWPNWHAYEWAIRRAAGLGKVVPSDDLKRYEIHHAHCDVLVVGAGASGLAAALAASAGGARVILAEQDTLLGGRLLWDRAEVEGLPAEEWVTRCEHQLASQPELRIFRNTTVTGYFDHNFVTMRERVLDNDTGRIFVERFWQVRAKRVILATGAIERPLVFGKNDLPGVMLSSAVRTYISRYAVRPGSNAVLFTNNDDAYQTASAYVQANGVLRAIVDVRDNVPLSLLEQMGQLRIPVYCGASVIAAHGRNVIRGVTIRSADGVKFRLNCNLLGMSGGFNPTVHLFSQSGGKLAFDEKLQFFKPAVSVQAERSVGAAAGCTALLAAINDGYSAGMQAAISVGYPGDIVTPKQQIEASHSHTHPCWIVSGSHSKAFVDFQNDVTTDDIALAVRENFVSIEHLKRYSALGMGIDQGKTSNINAIGIVAEITKRSIQDTGTTKFRFPYAPIPLEAFGGIAKRRLFRPLRYLPLHDWHRSRGAIFDDLGWLRPMAYLQKDETRTDAERREAMVVRKGAGLFDGSTLGKIEVAGPDAGRFLDFLYASAMSTLKIGKVRYGMMLNELGAVLDDGVCARIAENRFLVSTSSAGADRILAWMERWLQCEFRDYEVLAAPVTTNWAVLTLTGPMARTILQCIPGDIPLSADEFPHMSVRAGHIAGVPVRILRVSFTGELSFEINVPALRVSEFLDTLMASGALYGLVPVGIDAWNLLRIEKGYLHIGSDTDGVSTPLNLGWDHVLKRKEDFLGKRSLMLAENQRSSRLAIVGLKSCTSGALPIGAHIVARAKRGPQESFGYVTSSAFSPFLGHGVALGMLRGGRSQIGKTVQLMHREKHFEAVVVEPCFYDPEGTRLNG